MSVYWSPVGNGWQWLGQAGLVLSGGKINTYAAGTTTPIATYTDNTGTTPNANPIILDSTGRYAQEIWLTVGQSYKFVITDALGTIQFTLDNIPSGVFGASQVTYTAPFTGGVQETLSAKLSQFTSVMDFGADNTGVADSTTAFQNALNAVNFLFIPAGTYKLSATLTKTGPAYFMGAGKSVTILLWNTTVASGGFSLTGGPFTIRDMSLQTSVAGGGVAVAINAGVIAPSITVRDVIVIGDVQNTHYWNTGFSTINIRESIFDGVNIRGQVGTPASMTAAYDMTANSGSTNIIWNNCSTNSAGIGIRAVITTNPGIEGLYITNCGFILCNIGVQADASSSGYIPPGLQIVNSNFHTFDTAISQNTMSQANLQNNIIYRDVGTTNAIIFYNNGTENIISGNFLIHLATVTVPTPIQLGGIESLCIVEGNNIIMNGGTAVGIVLGASVTKCLVTNNQTNGGAATVTNANAGSGGNFIGGNYPPPANINSGIQVFANNATTPNVQGFPVDHFLTNNTIGTTITQLANIIPGQRVVIVVADANTTFQHNANQLMHGGINFAAPNGTVIQFMGEVSGGCRETSRD
jgi:hypothetical protein